MNESRWSFVERADGSAEIYMHDDSVSPSIRRLMLIASGADGAQRAEKLVQERNRLLRLTPRQTLAQLSA